MHFERSPAYHAQVFADVLECYAELDRSVNGAEWLAPLLARMATALDGVTHPDGMISLFNDGQFDVCTGKGLGAPIEEDLKSFPVRVEGGEIMVEIGG